MRMRPLPAYAPCGLLTCFACVVHEADAYAQAAPQPAPACGAACGANWEAPKGERWTLPLGLGLTRTMLLGSQPMNLGVQYYYNVERPEGTGASQLRFVIALLFPANPKAEKAK